MAPGDFFRGDLDYSSGVGTQTQECAALNKLASLGDFGRRRC